MINKRQIGEEYENKAIEFLQKEGYEILMHHFYTRFGEIDIIGKNDGYICFIEVKFRSNKNFGRAIEAIDLKKQKTIIKISKIYISKNNLSYNLPYRYDVICFDNGSINLYKNAFP